MYLNGKREKGQENKCQTYTASNDVMGHGKRQRNKGVESPRVEGWGHNFT